MSELLNLARFVTLFEALLRFRKHSGSNLKRSLLLLMLVGFAVSMHGQSSMAACPRPAAGSKMSAPPELWSHAGVLEFGLHIKYQQTVTGEGPPRYCYVTDDGLQSPTLHLFPGDQLIIHFHNDLPAWNATPMPKPHVPSQDADCTMTRMDPSFTNLHFHGMTIPPVCHQDDVMNTAIPTGQEFEYRVAIPRDEAPGVYWYHPHPHGYSERQVQGGAAGALIVEGIERVIPSLASLPQRMIILRDQQRIGPEPAALNVPSWDISANYVPVVYPSGVPATLETPAGRKEFWRILNAGADVIFNLQLLVDNVAQPMQVVAVDGVPVTPGKELPAQTSLLLPPGARLEVVVTTPKADQNAQLVTQAWDTGPQGDNDTKRTIANVVASDKAAREEHSAVTPASAPRWPGVQREPTPFVNRRLYFTQVSGNPNDPDNFVLYYITVAGQPVTLFKMGAPPNLVVHRGDVEDWTIENRSPEDHVWHTHQIHFRVLEIDGKPVNDPTLRDTIDVPYWSGDGPYHSVKLRMDFRDPNIVGTFLYHCHILKHEDLGMMGSIQVLPTGKPPKMKISTQRRVKPGDPIVLVASFGEANVSGTVQFLVDGREIAKPVPIANGQASFTTSFGEAGKHSFSAVYFGNATFDEATTAPVDVQVRE